MGTQLLERAFASFDEGALAGAIEPLAVNAHARRDDEPLDRLRGKTFEQNSRALRVVLLVVSDLVHAFDQHPPLQRNGRRYQRHPTRVLPPLDREHHRV